MTQLTQDFLIQNGFSLSTASAFVLPNRFECTGNWFQHPKITLVESDFYGKRVYLPFINMTIHTSVTVSTQEQLLAFLNG